MLREDCIAERYFLKIVDYPEGGGMLVTFIGRWGDLNVVSLRRPI